MLKSRILMVLICVVLIIFPVRCVSALSLSAECACVIDAKTGRVIYDKDMNKKHTMASTTKIMTALVALENSELTDIVTVSKNAAGEEGTSLYLKAGDTATMEDLLFGLMLQSGNDAAIAIAEAVSGSVSEFAVLMNKKAEEIGAKNSSFKNPNGLDEDGHYTTAYDLAIIARHALENSKFSEIVSTKTKSILDGTQTVSNHNKMLRNYDGCIGVKTGFTKKSGRCLVTAAERNGVKVIAVTLNAPNDWNDHKNMLDYGFSQTEYFPIIAGGMTVNTVSVKNGASKTVEVCAEKDFYISENKNEKFKNITVKCNIPKEITAPVKKGEKIGELTVFYKNNPLETINLLASVDIEYQENTKDSFLKNLKKLFISGCQKLSFSV